MQIDTDRWGSCQGKGLKSLHHGVDEKLTEKGGKEFCWLLRPTVCLLIQCVLADCIHPGRTCTGMPACLLTDSAKSHTYRPAPPPPPQLQDSPELPGYNASSTSKSLRNLDSTSRQAKPLTASNQHRHSAEGQMSNIERLESTEGKESTQQ